MSPIGSETSHGPYRALKIDGPRHYNFQAYFRSCIPFLYCTLCSPSNRFGTLFWSLWNSIRAQGTLLDLHGPQNGPQNGPCEANFRGPLIEKGPPGSLHGPLYICYIFAFYATKMGSRDSGGPFSIKGPLKFASQGIFLGPFWGS